MQTKEIRSISAVIQCGSTMDARRLQANLTAQTDIALLRIERRGPILVVTMPVNIPDMSEAREEAGLDNDAIQCFIEHNLPIVLAERRLEALLDSLYCRYTIIRDSQTGAAGPEWLCAMDLGAFLDAVLTLDDVTQAANVFIREKEKLRLPVSPEERKIWTGLQNSLGICQAVLAGRLEQEAVNFGPPM